MDNQTNVRSELLSNRVSKVETKSNPNLALNTSFDYFDYGETFSSAGDFAPYWKINPSLDSGTVSLERISIPFATPCLDADPVQGPGSIIKSEYGVRMTINGENLPRIAQKFRTSLMGRNINVSFNIRIHPSSSIQILQIGEIECLGTIYNYKDIAIQEGAHSVVGGAAITTQWQRLGTHVVLPSSSDPEAAYIEVDMPRIINSTLGNVIVEISDPKIEIGMLRTPFYLDLFDSSAQYQTMIREGDLSLQSMSTDASGILNFLAIKGDVIFLSGTNTITEIKLQKGREVRLIVSNAVTFTHNTSLLRMPGNVNYTTVNGQSNILHFVGLNGGIAACTALTYGVQSAINLKANLASPALTGTPTAPTAANTVSSTQLATTAYTSNLFAEGGAAQNQLLNGDFRQWDYGTSVSATNSVVPVTNGYCLVAPGVGIAGSVIRGICRLSSPSGVTTTASKQQDIDGNPYIRMESSNYDQNATISYFQELIPDITKFVGRNVTISFKARTTDPNTGHAYRVRLSGAATLASSDTFIGDSGSLTVGTNLTSTFQSFSVTLSVSAATFAGADKTGYLQIQLQKVTKTAAQMNFEVKDLKLEIGSKATAFIPRSDDDANIATSRTKLVYLSNENYLINSNFEIGQADSPAAISGYKYFTDGWSGRRRLSHLGMTVSRVANDTSSGFNLKVQRDVGDTQSGDLTVCQILDSRQVKLLAGKRITVSGRIRLGADYSPASAPTIGVRSGTVADEGGNPYGFLTGDTLIGSQTVPRILSTWLPFVVTVDVPTTARSLLVNFIAPTPTGTAGANDFYEIEGTVKLERGDIATPYVAPIYTDELRRCQYFFERFTREDSNFNTIQAGFWKSETEFRVPLRYQTKRAIPTITFSGTNHFVIDSPTDLNSSNIVAQQIGLISSRLVVTSSGGTAGQGGILAFNSAGNPGFIDISSRL